MISNNRNVFRYALLGSVAAATLVTPGFASAQQGSDDVAVDEIVVTGSRIRRDTFNSPLPLSVVTGEDVRAQGSVSLSEVLMDQPVIAAASNAQNTAGTLFLAGQARADIRGLGPSRTLVLMDGRRVVFSDASSPAVDLNLIPTLMVERIDVVPGGVSAVYGSEAIAGVVNVIMRKELDGFEADVQTGISQEGDGAEFRIGAMYGTKLLEDRMNVLIGGEVSRQEPIFQIDRENLYPGIRRNTLTPQGVVPVSRSNTSPYATFVLRGGALGTAVSATRDIRTNGATITRLSPECSTPTVQFTCQDESLFYTAEYNALQARNSRGIIRGYVDYQLTDTITAFGELSYARSKGYTHSQPAFSSAVGGGTLPIVLRGDNAFLLGNTAAAIELRRLITTPTAQGGAGQTLTAASTFQVGKFWQELGGRDVLADRDTLRAVVGMEGKFNALGRDFNWDWYGQFGKLTGETTSYGQPNLARVRNAVDAVLVNGQIVCRDVTARAAGCVPFDLINGASIEAIQYINAQSTTEQEAEQHVLQGNISTTLYELPAGPLGFAIGMEYRKEYSSFVQDALGASGALFINPIGTRSGEYHVSEGYAELLIPILRDLPFAESLSVELAGRKSNYTSIGVTDQWRAAAEWRPFEDLTFRASKATAVRAPNIVELYSPQSRNFTTAASDPCDAQVFAVATASQQAARRITCAAAIPGWTPAFVSNFGTGRSSLAITNGGNPQLGPEEAETYQLGFVAQPRWIPNLQISLDFFKYNLSGQIGTIPVNTLFQNLCYDSPQSYAGNPFCALITRDPTGANGGGVPGGVSDVQLTNQNVAKVKVEGYDASIAYGFQTADIFERDYGSVALRLDATWMYRFALQGLPGQAYTQFANTINNATPEWKVNGTIQWALNDLQVRWTTHFLGSMIANNAFTEAGLSPYYTGDHWTHDLRVSYQLNDQVRLRAGVINVTDEYPPYLPETFAGTGTGSSNYDNRGRFFFVGAGFTF